MNFEMINKKDSTDIIRVLQLTNNGAWIMTRKGELQFWKGRRFNEYSLSGNL